MKYADILEFIPQGYKLIERDDSVVRARNKRMVYRCYKRYGYFSISIEKEMPKYGIAIVEAEAIFTSIHEHEDASIDEKKLCQLISDLEASCNNTIKRREGVVK